jgi:phosphopantetheine--protein transferase-like protein
VPLFYQHTINENSQLAIWKIEETEAFFSEKVPLQRTISHPHKRLQHLAGRYLLQHLFSDFPTELILVADTRKPFLRDEAFHFSISHCGDYAAAIVSRVSRVGVDIELVKPIIHKIRHKFLSEQELDFLSGAGASNDDAGQQEPSSFFLTLCWSAKEAMYKWFGTGGVDFKLHMQLTAHPDFYNGEFIRSSYLFTKSEQLSLTVMSQSFGDLVLSFVISG